MTNCLPISAIVPTAQRAGPLRGMLASIAAQPAQPAELVVVDASTSDQTERLCRAAAGLRGRVIYLRARERGAAAQRSQALERATQPFVLFLDDDVILESGCLARLWSAVKDDPGLGGVSSMIINQRYAPPGPASRLLYRLLHGRREASYAGRCIGPAANLLPEDDPRLPEVVPVEWLNLGCTLYRREALPHPLFPAYFIGYSLMEDLHLSLTVGRRWRLANARAARIYHEGQPGEHKRDRAGLARMQLVNRYRIMTGVLGRRGPGYLMKLAALELFGTLTSLRSADGRAQLLPTLRGKAQGIADIVAGRAHTAADL